MRYFETLKSELWRAEARKTPYYLYLGSNACATLCNYCVFKDRAFVVTKEIIEKHKIEFELFYSAMSSYLKQEPVSVYLGGGTVNVLPIDHYRKIFETFEWFKKIKNKQIELHPRQLTKSWVDIVNEYKFNYISVGIQSFDNKFLTETQNRTNGNKAVETIINTKNSINEDARLNIDVFTMWENLSFEESIELLKKDLSIVNTLPIDVVNIYINYNNMSGIQNDGDVKLDKDKAILMDFVWQQEAIQDVLDKYLDSNIFSYTRKDINLIIEQPRLNIQIYRDDKDKEIKNGYVYLKDFNGINTISYLGDNILNGKMKFRQELDYVVYDKINGGVKNGRIGSKAFLS